MPEVMYPDIFFMQSDRLAVHVPLREYLKEEDLELAT